MAKQGQAQQLPLLQGLAPLWRSDARILILGSMPGQLSLQQQQYYGHPRNQFWLLMQALFGIDAQAAYADKCQQLQEAGVALWDVIGLCQRAGSLDSAICRNSIVFNDLASLIQQLPHLERIGLNGGQAAQSFKKYQKAQALLFSSETLHGLPSSSPAHASVSFADKAQRWRAALCPSRS